MKKFIILLFIILFSPGYLFNQGTQIQHIDFLVKNEANNDYQGVLWINAEDIYSLLPEFDEFSFIVTTTHSSDIAADLKKKETEELESQPYYDRTKRTSIGEELFITKKAPGFGKLGVLREGEILGLSGKMPDNIYISGKGPLVSGINISSTYGTDVKVNSQFTIARGSRWTLADVSLSGTWSGIQFITGIPIRPDEKTVEGDDYIAAFAGMPSLGLAIYVPVEYIQDIKGYNGYNLVYLKPDETGHIR